MVVAITGRSGSGKTEVANYYRSKGYQVIDADKIAHQILNEDKEVYCELIEKFGTDILDENKAINSKILGNIVFLEKERIQALTKITHPAIIKHILMLINQNAHGLTFVDGAIIVGEMFERYCDKIIVITAERTDAVSRIVLRDGVSRTAAENRLKSQCSEECLREKADFLIENKGGKEQLTKQADVVLKSVIELYNAQN